MKFMCRMVAAIFCLFLVACTTRTGDLNLVATKNINSLRNAEPRGRFEASDCKYFGFGVPNVEEAIDRTIEKTDGNALVDAVLYVDIIPIFKSCVRAKGTVVKMKHPGEE